MSEKAKIRALSAVLFPLILAAGAATSYLLEGGAFGQPFLTGVFFGIFYCGPIIVWPKPSTRSQARERSR